MHNIKRYRIAQLIIFSLSLFLLCWYRSMPANAEENLVSQDSRGNVHWDFYEDCSLYITGEGTIETYFVSRITSLNSESITKIVIGDGDWQYRFFSL